MKQLNLNQTVYSATKQYPELINIIADLGFPQVRNRFLRNSLGKRYTINQAITLARLDRAHVLEVLKNNGFTVV